MHPSTKEMAKHLCCPDDQRSLRATDQTLECCGRVWPAVRYACYRGNRTAAKIAVKPKFVHPDLGAERDGSDYPCSWVVSPQKKDWEPCSPLGSTSAARFLCGSWGMAPCAVSSKLWSSG